MWFSLLIGCATKTIDDTGADLTDTAVSSDCLESAAGELPEDAVWITLDGQSSQLLSPADGLLDSNWQGQYGTYDLNTVAFEGANGFLLERPGTVVAAQAKWSNLPEDLRLLVSRCGQILAATYMWDSDNLTPPKPDASAANDGSGWIVRFPHPYGLSIPCMSSLATAEQSVRVAAQQLSLSCGWRISRSRRALCNRRMVYGSG